MNALYPVFVNLADRTVLVVGSGTVAERKIRALIPTGARILVHATQTTPQVQAWTDEGKLTLHAGPFQNSWLDDCWLVIVANEDRAQASQVARDATRRRRLVNVVDDIEQCVFQVPAVIDRSPLVVAVSSSGVAPVFARRMRERLEALFEHSLADLARLAGEHRTAIRRSFPDASDRRRFYDWLFDGPVPGMLRQGRQADASNCLLTALDAPGDWPDRVLTVVDPGPGDPGLITLKGLRALHEADAVIHGAGTEPAILDMARRDADRIPAGQITLDDGTALAEAVVPHFATYRRVVILARNTHTGAGWRKALAAGLAKHTIEFEQIPGVSTPQ